jgi:tetratricopeptide (TPR) repeat protein
MSGLAAHQEVQFEKTFCDIGAAAKVDNWPLKAQTKYWMFRGRRKYKQKRYSEALEYFEKVISAGTASSITLAHAGFCLAKLKRYDEAIDSYQRAFQGNVEHGVVHAQLAEIYSQMERFQQAYDSLNRAFRSNPKL